MIDFMQMIFLLINTFCKKNINGYVMRAKTHWSMRNQNSSVTEDENYRKIYVCTQLFSSTHLALIIRCWMRTFVWYKCASKCFKRHRSIDTGPRLPETLAAGRPARAPLNRFFCLYYEHCICTIELFFAQKKSFLSV